MTTKLTAESQLRIDLDLAINDLGSRRYKGTWSGSTITLSTGMMLETEDGIRGSAPIRLIAMVGHPCVVEISQ